MENNVNFQWNPLNTEEISNKPQSHSIWSYNSMNNNSFLGPLIGPRETGINNIKSIPVLIASLLGKREQCT